MLFTRLPSNRASNWSLTLLNWKKVTDITWEHFLKQRIEETLATGTSEHIPWRIRDGLAAILRIGNLSADERFRRTKPDTYARRLLYADPAGRYSVVVMTWGAGQSTPIHDHAGVWCVEGVAEGEIDVTQYRLARTPDGKLRFEPQPSVHAGLGSTGALIPPQEYHRLANRTDQTAITVHIYGGEIRECHAYFSQPDGSYRREMHALSYDD